MDLESILTKWLTIVVTIATVITAALPSVANNPIINFILKLLNTVAGNIGKNKNADAE